MIKSTVCACFSLLLACGAVAGSTGQPATPSRSGGAPAGYDVVITTSFGKKLVAHKAEAKSVEATLAGALQDLSRCFDARPIAKGAFVEAK
jgi:phosphate-selective porin